MRMGDRSPGCCAVFGTRCPGLELGRRGRRFDEGLQVDSARLRSPAAPRWRRSHGERDAERGSGWLYGRRAGRGTGAPGGRRGARAWSTRGCSRRPGRDPVRRGRVGAPRRRHRERARRGRVRAARRRGAEVLVAAGDQHRRVEVLPRRRSARRSASGASGSSSAASSTRSPAGRATQRYFATEADLQAFRDELTHLLVLPEGRRSTARSGSTAASRRTRSARPASSTRSRTRWTRS